MIKKLSKISPMLRNGSTLPRVGATRKKKKITEMCSKDCITYLGATYNRAEKFKSIMTAKLKLTVVYPVHCTFRGFHQRPLDEWAPEHQIHIQ
jgi:hypothetical protein